MPTATYTPLATVTLGSTAATVTFSSIPATYRDLILVANYSISSGQSQIQLNSDTGSNYSTVLMSGSTAGGAQSNSFTTTFFQIANLVGEPTTTRNLLTLQLMDYSATDKHKTGLIRSNNAETGGAVQAQANRWANTAAITSFTIYNATFLTGSTFSLYGVIA
jgi:hypothetical protein